MADELDSGSSVGYHVWVQVPFPAEKQREDLGFCLGPLFIVQLHHPYHTKFADAKSTISAVKRDINLFPIDIPAYISGSFISFLTFAFLNYE